ncbi:hypothetical protein L6452_17346 [Arctium lappa]|uniref:Uncharacterized protein n=1 Tax=Arctium lappa TaxID=4217 RepID=A0ACB9C3A6_ARCLA|nr:hypothetical protein L6452_17346 [Arctium lappa]
MIEIKIRFSDSKCEGIAFEVSNFGFSDLTGIIEDDQFANEWEEMLKSEGQGVFEIWKKGLYEMGFGVGKVVEENMVNGGKEEPCDVEESKRQ